MPKVELLGVQVDDIRLSILVDEIVEKIHSREHFLISHVNVTGLNLAYQYPWLKDFYNTCDRVYCDGMGVMLGARLLGKHISERFTLADWIWALAEQLAANRQSLFLLGGKPGVAERAAQQLRQQVPDLVISGSMHGYFNKAKNHPENQAVIQALQTANPDLLLVGMGMPLQEKWLKENWSEVNARVAITCGALFEYMIGDLQRGPRWMTQNYLEWLARMVISPGRYAGRYLRDNPLFLYRVMKQKLGYKK